jgi:hypothetical protein
MRWMVVAVVTLSAAAVAASCNASDDTEGRDDASHEATQRVPECWTDVAERQTRIVASSAPLLREAPARMLEGYDELRAPRTLSNDNAFRAALANLLDTLDQTATAAEKFDDDKRVADAAATACAEANADRATSLVHHCWREAAEAAGRAAQDADSAINGPLADMFSAVQAAITAAERGDREALNDAQDELIAGPDALAPLVRSFAASARVANQAYGRCGDMS